MSAQQKTTHECFRDDISIAVSSMIGRRFTMEDEHIVNLNFLGRFLLFAVFDGHGGDKTAKYCQSTFTDVLTDKLKDIDFENDDLVGETLKNCFIEIDGRICEILQREENESGTTAVCAIVTNDKIIVANCGDSRSVLGTKNGTVPMSHDHKPTQKAEKARIKEAGGLVILGRVNGDLAVSRALGDCTFKDKTKEPQKELVSCVPDIQIQRRDETKDEVLFLACDGVWDIMKSEEAVEFFKREYQLNQNVKAICEKMLDHCYDNGSSDNMTLICVKFPGIDLPNPINEESKKEDDEEEKKDVVEEKKEMSPSLQTPNQIPTDFEKESVNVTQTDVPMDPENPSQIN